MPRLAFLIALIALVTFAAGTALALPSQYVPKARHYKDPGQAASEGQEKPPHKEKLQFPYLGWHTGPYIAANVGMMSVKNDRNAATGRNFDGAINPAFGFTFGYDFRDWIGPMFQLNYSTNTDTVGNGTANFPTENARENVFNLNLFLRLTFFTQSELQPKAVKILPYVKVGGMSQILYVDAPSSNNSFATGAGGMSFGGGAEFYLWRGIFIALDFTENLFWQKSYYRTIGGVRTKTLDFGFKTNFTLLGLFGWHF